MPLRSTEAASSTNFSASFANKLRRTADLALGLVLAFAGNGFFFATGFFTAGFLETLRVARFLDEGR
jgi:hypothetical protein